MSVDVLRVAVFVWWERPEAKLDQGMVVVRGRDEQGRVEMGKQNYGGL